MTGSELLSQSYFSSSRGLGKENSLPSKLGRILSAVWQNNVVSLPGGASHPSTAVHWKAMGAVLAAGTGRGGARGAGPSPAPGHRQPSPTSSTFPSTSSPLCLTESQSKWGKQGEVSARAAVFWEVHGPQGWFLKGPSQMILFPPVLLLISFIAGPRFQAMLRDAIQSN